MPCPFTGPKMFWAGPNFLCQTKSLFTYCGSHKQKDDLHLCLVLLQVPKCFVPVQIFWASPKNWLHLVPLQNFLCRHKNQFYWMQIIFLSGTKFLCLPQYEHKFLVWHKKFGPAQNVSGPVKGQGMCLIVLKLFKMAQELLWHLICWKSHAVTPKCSNF